jgi:hypothetical protein
MAHGTGRQHVSLARRFLRPAGSSAPVPEHFCSWQEGTRIQVTNEAPYHELQDQAQIQSLLLCHLKT